MKESTKLILAAAGAGIASNMLLGGPVSGATASMPMAAAGAEGLAALGAGWYAYKKKSLPAAIAAGVFAGLLASSVQSGALAAPKPSAGGATPQSATVVKPGSTLPSISTPSGAPAASALPTTSITTGGGSSTWNTASGSMPPGSSLPATSTPNRPPTQAEINAYNAYAAQSEAAVLMQQAANQQAMQAENMNQGTPIVAQYDDQSGAAARLGMAPRKRAGMGGAFKGR